MKVPSEFALCRCCGSSFHNLGPAYLIELLWTWERLQWGIGSFPWVSDLKCFLVRSGSSRFVRNDGAKPLTHWYIVTNTLYWIHSWTLSQCSFFIALLTWSCFFKLLITLQPIFWIFVAFWVGGLMFPVGVYYSNQVYWWPSLKLLFLLLRVLNKLQILAIFFRVEYDVPQTFVICVLDFSWDFIK